MAKNKINDLRDHIFAQLERLNDEDLTPDDLDFELKRAKGISALTNSLMETAKAEIQYLTAVGAIKSESYLFQDVQKQLQ